MLNRKPINVRFVNIHVTGKVILKDTKGYIQTKNLINVMYVNIQVIRKVIKIYTGE